MKYLLYTFALFSIIFLFSCSNDTTTNTGNGNGNETVIYSIDSLSITLNTMFGIIDSNFTINNAPNLKVTFNCSTNADSVNSFALFRISAGDSSIIYKDTLNDNISELNNDFVIVIHGSSNYILNFYLQVNGFSPYFIRLRNIKVIKT